MVSANISSECWVLSVPDVHGQGESADAFAIEEPDDEKTFAMVDKGECDRRFVTCYITVDN